MREIYIYVYIPIGKVSAPSVKTQITMGRRAFRKPEKSAQIYGNQHGTLWANNRNNHLFHFMFGAFYSSKKWNYIVETSSMQSLFAVTLNFE
jgi:hypothetical protein